MKASDENSRSRAQVFGSPGAHPRFVAFLKGVTPMLLFMVLGGYFLRAALPYPMIPPFAAGLFLVVLCILFAATLFYSEKRLAAYFKGAEGEEQVARVLHRLPSEYTVFHGVVLSSGMTRCDIDHVVAGPYGIYVIETKNWSGRVNVHDGVVLCNGKHPSRPPLKQASSAACNLQSKLREDAGVDVEVLPVLCFARSNVEGGIQGSQGVQICSPEDLLEVLQEHSGEKQAVPAQMEKVIGYLKSQERRSA